MSDELLFVYGTLRPAALSRAPAHVAKAVQARARVVGAGTVAGALHKVSWYPALIDAADSRVSGDVYALDTALLDTLDIYEGAEYARRRITVALDDGHDIEAWTYIYLDTAGLGERIQSGDFISEAAPN